MDLEKLIDQLSDQDIKELSKLIYLKNNKKAENEIKQTVEEHKGYIGKCYKKKIYLGDINSYRYIKLIKAESENENWMEALMFENPIYYTFRYKSRLMGFPGNYIFGNIDYDGIRIEEVSWFTPSGQIGYKEITIEEFNEAMDQHVAELKNKDWS